MQNQFKFFSRPYSIAFVDDDRDFLELLSMALPNTWNTHYFSKTNTFIDFIHQNMSLSKRDFSLLGKVLQANHRIENPIVNMLSYWRQNPQRWSICDLGVLDFAMPKMSGLDVLNELPTWQGLRVLLTGVADEKIAVQAFNAALIHQYLPKQNDDLRKRLEQAVTDLNQNVQMQVQMLIQSHLSDEQLSMLKDTTAAHQLTIFAQTHWVEYVVLGNPFGVLGLSEKGQLSWLQLERACDIEDLKSIAKTEPWDSNTLDDIDLGHSLSNSLLRQALGNEIEAAIAPVISFGCNGLIAAHFKFEAPWNLRATCNYNEWFKSSRNRSIQD